MDANTHARYLIVDAIGALIGASAGWAYLKGRHGPLVGAIRAFVDRNRRLFGDD